VYLAGNEYFYHLLPKVKDKFPEVKVIDQLYNEVGHMANNRRYKDFVDFNIVENETIRRILIEKYLEDEKKIRVIPNGVDVHHFQPFRKPSDTIRQKLGIPGDKKIVLFLGRMSEEKAPDIFVELAKRFRNDDRVMFVMGGDGPMFSSIMDQIGAGRLNDKLLCPGFIDSKEI